MDQYCCCYTDPAYSSSMLPSNQIVVEGTKVTFPCLIDTEEVPKVSWWKDGRRVDYKGLLLDGSTQPISNILVIDNVSVEDGGMYVCVGGDDKEHNSTLTVIGTSIAIAATIRHSQNDSNENKNRMHNQCCYSNN